MSLLEGLITDNRASADLEPPVRRKRACEALLIGPTPPPYNGMSVATELVKKALDEVVSSVHIDTADRRGLSNVGKIDFTNVFLAFTHGAKFLRMLAAKRPEIVYVPISQAWIPFMRDCLFALPARIFGKKLIVHLHGSYFGEFYRNASRPMQALIRYALGRTAAAVVLGENAEAAFDGIIPRNRIHVVPNGIVDRFIEQSHKEENQHHNRKLRLLFLSTLLPSKGLFDLLEVLHKVRDCAGTVQAVFAGEWCSKFDRQKALKIVHSCGLQDLVSFAGPAGPCEKVRLLRAADVFVLPTRNEGQPYAILEAMAAALPIISTTVGCIPETVRDGIEGFLIPPGDLEALAERICHLMLDEDCRRRMGRAARARFLAEYTFEKFAQRLRAVFTCVREANG